MSRLFGTALLGLLLAASPAHAQQLQYLSGQSVQPFFEGWERNADGSFDMVFGYLNRNFREELNIPLGPNNRIEPQGTEQAQPTYFYPRRHRYMFRIRVPKDFGKRELVWSVTANGKTERAIGYLVPEMESNAQVEGDNRGGGTDEKNRRPSIAASAPVAQTVAAGQPLTLAVTLADDNLPPPLKTAPRISESDMPGVGVDPDGSGRRLVAVGRFGRRNMPGLRAAFLQWRGPGKVSFDPWYMEGVDDHMPDFAPPAPGSDGRVTTTARFSEPGTYIIRAYADDGSLLSSPLDFTVTVTGP